MYPVVLGTHLACIAVFGGMILMTDLRLLGVTFQGLTITEVVTTLRPWKRLGGVIMITMGLLLGTSEAEKYAPNPYFWTKMTLLTLIGVHALVFRPMVYNKTEELDRSPVIPMRAKAAGVSFAGSVDRHVHHGKAHCLLRAEATGAPGVSAIVCE